MARNPNKTKLQKPKLKSKAKKTKNQMKKLNQTKTLDTLYQYKARIQTKLIIKT